MIVPDANIIMALCLPTEKTEVAAKVLWADRDWHAPALWISEFRNGSAEYIRKGFVNTSTVIAAQGFARQIIRNENTHQIDDYLVMELVSKYPCTAYDCEYVALAEKLKAPLVTWDKDILKYFPNIAITPEFFIEYRHRNH